MILGDKLSFKKIDITKTVIVRKKINCKLCQEYDKEYEMLKFELKNRKKNSQKKR